MYVVKRKSSWLERSFLIIGFMGLVLLLYIVVFSPETSAQSAGQVHLQQEAVWQFYEDTFQEEPLITIPSGSDTVIVKGESIEIEETFPEEFLIIIPSASDAVNVSVVVFENLSLSVVEGNPKYATNWKFGATLHQDLEGDSVLIWTVTANY